MRPRLAYGVCVQRRTTQLLQCRRSDQLSENGAFDASCPRVGDPPGPAGRRAVAAAGPARGPTSIWQHHAEPLLAGRRRWPRSTSCSALAMSVGRPTGTPTPGCSWCRWRSWPAPASCCCTRWPRPGVLIGAPQRRLRPGPAGRAGARPRCSRWCPRCSWPGDRSGGVAGSLAAAPGLVALLLVAWAVVSLLDLPPLEPAAAAARRRGSAGRGRVVAVALYVVAAVRFYLLHRRAPGGRAAEPGHRVRAAGRGDGGGDAGRQVAPVVVGVARAADVRVRLRRVQRVRAVPPGGHRSAGLFDAIGLAETTRRIRAEYGAALEELVTALQERERSGRGARAGCAARLADRFGLTEGQAAVLDRAGAALAAERELTRPAGRAGRGGRAGPRRRRRGGVRCDAV